jgi:epoxyqueuosine reductase
MKNVIVMQNAIIELLPNQNEYIIGFADMEQLLSKNYPFRYAIVIGAKLDDAIIDNIENTPTIEYFNLYHNKNKELNELVLQISNFLTKENIDNQYIFATGGDSELDADYSKTLRNKYSHKMAATRAGIGWIGKTDLLISEKFGPRIRLASVLTNLKFQNVGTPITESRCGDCMVCVEKCPGQVANGKLWNTNTDRDEFFNAIKCKDTCRKRSFESIGKEISLCGVCVSVCPQGKNKREKKQF